MLFLIAAHCDRAFWLGSDVTVEKEYTKEEAISRRHRQAPINDAAGVITRTRAARTAMLLCTAHR